jgi:hypothetical protein
MNDQPLTPMEFDATDRPSMGDPEVVGEIVKEMLDEVRKLLLEAPETTTNPQAELKPLIARYADKLYAGNSEYVQTMTPEAQVQWLQDHGLGTEDTDPKGPITCLIAATIKRFCNAVIPFAEQQIDEDQCQFRIDTAIEDCTAMLLGVENPAD